MTISQFLSENKKLLLLIYMVFMFMLFFYGRIDPRLEIYDSWDFHKYLLMAESSPGISSDIPQPFAFRILGPYLAGLLPFELNTGFYLLSLLASAVLIFVFFFFLCSLKIDRKSSAIAVLFFILNKYFFGYSIWNYYQLNDILSLIFILLLLMFLLKESWLRFAIVLIIGVLARETAIIMIPVSLIYILERRLVKSSLLKWLAAVLPGLVVFIILRLLIEPAGGQNLWEAFLTYSAKLGSPGPWMGMTVICTIPLSLVPLIYLGDTIAFFRRRIHLLVFIILVFISTLFGINNERLMAPVFVVFYTIIALFIKSRITGKLWLLYILFACALVSTFDDWSGVYVLPSRNVMITMGLISLTIATIATIANKLTSGRSKKYLPEF